MLLVFNSVQSYEFLQVFFKLVHTNYIKSEDFDANASNCVQMRFLLLLLFVVVAEPVKEMMPTPGKMLPTTGYIDTEFRNLSEILNA